MLPRYLLVTRGRLLIDFELFRAGADVGTDDLGSHSACSPEVSRKGVTEPATALSYRSHPERCPD